MTQNQVVETIGEAVARHARVRPGHPAFVDAATGRVTTWAQYDTGADELARLLRARYRPGDRLAVAMADAAPAHLALLGLERAGLVAVVLPPDRPHADLARLANRHGARELITQLPHSLGRRGAAAAAGPPPVDPDAPWVLTSTGDGPAVVHTTRRWCAQHEVAADAARLDRLDVFLGALGSPFGDTLWSSHVTPALLGAPCVLAGAAGPDVVTSAIERHQVTVLAAPAPVLEQILDDPASERADLGSLRCVLVPHGRLAPDRVQRLEHLTRCPVVHLWGTDLTGVVARTTVWDPDPIRWRSAGALVPGVEVRLYDPETGEDVTGGGRPGLVGARGPTTSLGNDGVPDRGRTTDGWWLTDTIATLDGAVLVPGPRHTRVIRRGGVEIDAEAVEDAVATYPPVAAVLAVAKADPVFGERVAVCCAQRPGTAPFSLIDLRVHLAAQGTPKSDWPEYLMLIEGDLPRYPSGRVASGALRDQVMALPVLDQ